MKKTIYIIAAFVAAVSCSKNTPVPMREYSFETVYTKAVISNVGKFSWDKNDRIAVWNESGNAFVNFTSVAGKGVFSAMAPADAHFEGSAFYPAGIPVSNQEVNLPGSYASALEPEMAFPMHAVVQDGSKLLSFKHLGAMANFSIIRFSPEADHLEISSPGKKLSGAFQLSSGSSSIQEVQVTEGSGSIKVAFTPGESTLSVTVPLPVGSYPLTIKLLKGEETLLEVAGTENLSFARAVFTRFRAIDANPVNAVPIELVKTESYSLEEEDELWD